MGLDGSCIRLEPDLENPSSAGIYQYTFTKPSTQIIAKVKDLKVNDLSQVTSFTVYYTYNSTSGIYAGLSSEEGRTLYFEYDCVGRAILIKDEIGQQKQLFNSLDIKGTKISNGVDMN